MKKWLLDRVKEPSTWRGVALFLGAAGVGVDPTQAANVGVGVAAALGVIESLRKEQPGV